MRKKIMVFIVFTALLIPAPHALAEWMSVTGDLPESDIRTVLASPANPQIMYAASSRRLYRSPDSGVHWKQLLGVRGSTAEIREVLVHPKDSSRLFVASDKGIQTSSDEGQKWDWLYRGIGDNGKAVQCLAIDIQGPERLWAGTNEGLVRIDARTREVTPIQGLPKERITSVLLDGQRPGWLWVHGEKGVYKSEDEGVHWDRMMVRTKESSLSQETGESAPLSQFQIEEIAAAPVFSNIVRFGKSDRLYAASAGSFWSGTTKDQQWTRVNSSIPEKEVRSLAEGDGTIYAATDKGVYLWDPSQNISKEISDGLTTKQVHRLWYDSGTADLYAATKKGVFRYPKPAVSQGIADKGSLSVPLTSKEILQSFGNEPSILQIQNAAIRYAEVHPDKINAWRDQAARKALLPSLSVSTGLDKSQNVDLDRGGTGDPDKFIIGPEEKSFDWRVGVSWDLGDMIWNDDQTSIDTRSRLMVELRDDVLTEVTHLYYERRRLQVEMRLSPPKELPLQLEKQIKLEELTASIDALTGGYLTRFLEVGHE